MSLHTVDCDYAHRLATMLECALLNRLGSWDEGHALLDEYRAACRAVMPDAPTFMGEPVIDDVFTAELVEIDGHTYGLRPGAARVVREALRYRNALACIATVAATEHDYQELALRVLGETDHMKLIQWRNAAIDGDVFTAMLVEIDGHAYGLRPNAAHIVKEAMADARRYRRLFDCPEPFCYRGEVFETKVVADNAIDTDMRKTP